MVSNCVICHTRAGVFRCLRCHKPVCNDCAFKTEYGAFCCRRCAGQYRDFKRSQPVARKRSLPGLLGTLVILLVLGAIAFGLAWRMGWLPESWKSSMNNKAVQLKEAAKAAKEKAIGATSEAPEQEAAESP